MNIRIGCWIATLLALLVLSILLPNMVSFYMDWLWFQEVGYQQVFTTIWSTRFGIWIGCFLAVYALIYSNWYYAARRLPVVVRNLRLDPEGLQVIDIGQYSARFGKPLVVILAILLAQSAASEYQTLLAYLHHSPFNESDPILGRDISFYIFVLPFWEYLCQLALWVTGATLLLITALGWARSAVDLGPQGLTIAARLRGQLTLLGILLLLLLGAQSYLLIPNLGYSTRGPVQGASFTDIRVVIPAVQVLIATFVVGAFLLAYNYFRKRRFLVPGTVLLCFAMQFLGTEILPQLVQKFIVAPNELVKESPYIERNIFATRKAFGVDSVQERDLSGEGRLTAKDIQNNAATLHSVRLWDHRPLLDTFAQIQEIRTYYDFISVDNDRYLVQGEPRQMMLSPRELAPENLPDRRWLNENLTYTHGFGLTMGPVNQVTPDGLPVLLVKDIPPVSSVDSIQVKRPEIYYGERGEQYAFVGTLNREFNYPSGEENVYSTYEGKGGVPVNGLVRKALMALHFRSLNIFTSPLITAESRVLFHRNIRERVARIAPFLMLDRDPYMVVTQEGRLVWILDAYTVSDRYPYSQRFGASGVNYIRNSVKVTVDAYDGVVRFFLINTGDPLAATYGKMFPTLFRPISEMSPDLQAHLRYPEDLFSLQTQVYSTYHMGQPQIFYNREDQWEIPKQAGAEDRMSPYYTIMKLPGEKQEEFILMLPFTPRGKDNLSAWLAGRCDGPNYGRLVAYRFPKQKLVFGPKQIENRISQDTVISQEITLWDQRGSQVINGTLLVIPVEESLIYVRALFIRAEGGKIPELKRVVVAYENRIVMAPTLDEAMIQVFSEGSEAPAQSLRPAGAPQAPVTAASVATGPSAELAARARQHFERALEAQRQGNWALYGEEIRKLGEAIQQMQPKK